MIFKLADSHALYILTIAFLSLQGTTEEGDLPWQRRRSAYAATVLENKKPPRNGGFAAFLRIWNCINLGVVLSIKLINSTYHLSNLSTQHPQYQNQPLNSPPIFTIDQFPLTRKIKNPGSETCPLTSPDSRKSLVFYIFSIFYSLTFDINTTHSTWFVPLNISTATHLSVE